MFFGPCPSVTLHSSSTKNNKIQDFLLTPATLFWGDSSSERAVMSHSPPPQTNPTQLERISLSGISKYQGLSGKETKYLCEYGISCVCLWPTGITGIPVTTVKKMSRKILFLYIFIWKVKVTFLNQFRELQIFCFFSCQISGTGSAGTRISNTVTGNILAAQILGFCSTQPLGEHPCKRRRNLSDGPILAWR